MTNFLTLDLETVPQARFLDPAAWPDGPHPEGWEDDVRAGRAEVWATSVAPSLHATTCHIVQVSFGWRTPEGSLQRIVSQSDGFGPTVAEAEPLLLFDALRMLASACEKRTTIVSFNGKGFDIPLLRARAALLRVKSPRIPWRRLLYPYDDNQHADLRLVLSADDRRARGTLQWWSEAFGVHAEEHGAEVGAWVRAGEWDKLRAYGEVEAKTLVELYEAMEPIL